MKSMKKVVLGLVALSLALQPLVAVGTLKSSSSAQICADETRSSGGISRARFLYQKVQDLPEAQFSVRFGNQEAEQDLKNLFSSQQMQNVAKTSILPGIKRILEILTKEMADFAKSAEKTREISVRIEFPQPTIVPLRSAKTLVPRSQDLVAKFVFKKGTTTGKKAAAMTVEVTTFGSASKMPVHVLNLFKAILLDDTFAQKYGMICVASAAALLVVGIGGGAFVRNTRTATQKDLTVFDGLAQKMCDELNDDGAAEDDDVPAESGGGAAAGVASLSMPKKLAVDLKQDSIFGPIEISSFPYDKTAHADKELIVATVFFDGQLGRLAESLKWPYVEINPAQGVVLAAAPRPFPQQRKLVVPRNLLPTDEKELKRIAACLTYGRWELVVVDAREKLKQEAVRDFHKDRQAFVSPAYEYDSVRAPAAQGGVIKNQGFYFSHCELLSVVFNVDEAEYGSSCAASKGCESSSPAPRNQSMLGVKTLKRGYYHQQLDVSTEGATATPEEKQNLILSAARLEVQQQYLYAGDVFAGEAARFTGCEASLLDAYDAEGVVARLGTGYGAQTVPVLVVDFNDIVARDAILRNAKKLENAIVLFDVANEEFAGFDVAKQCPNLKNVAVFNNIPMGHDLRDKEYKSVKNGKAQGDAVWEYSDTLAEWKGEIEEKLALVGFHEIDCTSGLAGDAGLNLSASGSSRVSVTVSRRSTAPKGHISYDIPQTIAKRLGEKRVEGVGRVEIWYQSNLLYTPAAVQQRAWSASCQAPVQFAKVVVYQDKRKVVEAQRVQGDHDRTPSVGTRGDSEVELPLIEILLPQTSGGNPSVQRSFGGKVLQKDQISAKLTSDQIQKQLWDALTDQIIGEAVAEYRQPV